MDTFHISNGRASAMKPGTVDRKGQKRHMNASKSTGASAEPELQKRIKKKPRVGRSNVRFVRELGAGSFGTVLLVRVEGMSLALKFPKESDPTAARHFARLEQLNTQGLFRMDSSLVPGLTAPELQLLNSNRTAIRAAYVKLQDKKRLSSKRRGIEGVPRLSAHQVFFSAARACGSSLEGMINKLLAICGNPRATIEEMTNALGLMWRLLRSAIHTLARLHALGFTHGDVKGGNMALQAAKGTAMPAVVFLDMGTLQNKAGSMDFPNQTFVSPLTLLALDQSAGVTQALCEEAGTDAVESPRCSDLMPGSTDAVHSPTADVPLVSAVVLAVDVHVPSGDKRKLLSGFLARSAGAAKGAAAAAGESKVPIPLEETNDGWLVACDKVHADRFGFGMYILQYVLVPLLGMCDGHNECVGLINEIEAMARRSTRLDASMIWSMIAFRWILPVSENGLEASTYYEAYVRGNKATGEDQAYPKAHELWQAIDQARPFAIRVHKRGVTRVLHANGALFQTMHVALRVMCECSLEVANILGLCAELLEPLDNNRL